MVAILLVTLWGDCLTCVAQTGGQTSCHDFVRDFYDGYLKADLKSANYETEVREHPSLFSDQIRRGLLRKLKLEEDGQIHGFEFDPFLNAQDAPGPYTLDSASERDTSCKASLHSGSGPNRVKVNVELTSFKGSWRFTDFIYTTDGKQQRLTSLLRKDALR